MTVPLHEMPPMKILDFIPYLSIKDCHEALPFYTNVFGVEPVHLMTMPDGRVMHCEYSVDGAKIYLSEELPEHGGTPSPKTLGASSVAIHLYVDDCDAMVALMKEHGAKILTEPEDQFWGERFARARDPFGHEWGISQKIREMTPQEIQAEAAKLFASMPSE
ncbi:MAG: VOC family protein [Planctomycetota bacterium]|nr:VOC family protein [Planctomycetota bacterium]